MCRLLEISGSFQAEKTGTTRFRGLAVVDCWASSQEAVMEGASRGGALRGVRGQAQKELSAKARPVDSSLMSEKPLQHVDRVVLAAGRD